MKIDWLAIAAATGAAWVFGAAWYGILGQRWMTAAGLTDADLAGPGGRHRAPIIPMIVSLVAEFVMALILAGVIAHTAKKGVTTLFPYTTLFRDRKSVV